MKTHEEKFGEQPKDNRVYDNFIRKGISGEGKKLPKNIRENLSMLSDKYFQ